MNILMQKWMDLTQWLSSRGIPLIWIRDPKTGVASVSLTLMIVTFTLCVLSVIDKIANSKLFGDVNASDSFNLFIATSALYFGRNISSGGANSSTKSTDSTATDNK